MIEVSDSVCISYIVGIIRVAYYNKSFGYLHLGHVGSHRSLCVDKCYYSRFLGLSECSVQELNPNEERVFLLFYCSRFHYTTMRENKIIIRPDSLSLSPTGSRRYCLTQNSQYGKTCSQ